MDNTITGTDERDRIFGDANDNVILGGAERDKLAGAAGDDTLFGGDDGDILRGDEGADTLDGGAGQDRADYTTSDEGVQITLGRSASGGDAEGDVLISIEDIIGSDHRDRIIGDENDNVISGGAERDKLAGAGGDDRLFGGDGGDILRGDEGADILDGGAGQDRADYTTSDEGVSITLGRSASGGDAEGDVLISIEDIIGSAHRDRIIGDENDNVISGGAERDKLAGAGGDDRLFGGDGGDILRGDEGADQLDGGAGIDVADYTTSDAGVSITLGRSASGGDAEGDVLTNIENVTGSAHRDRIIGDENDNLISGGAERDKLAGADGDDRLFGGDGGDILRGDRGADQLTGGTGRDSFVFTKGGGADLVTDFEAGNDRLDVRAFDFDDFDAIEGSVRQNGTDVVIELDAAAGDQVTLLGVQVSDLQEADFIF